MSAYIASLKAAQNIVDQERLDAEHAKVGAARERLTPLEDRLARLLATIPADMQRDGLSLPALQASLRGRWRGNAHPGELGRALRKAGFVRKRDWRRGDTAFQARWFPAE